MLAGELAARARLLRIATVVVLLAVATSVSAIDNPDAPDRVGAFEHRAAPFEQQLVATDGGSAAIRAGQAYASFLEAELNAAYSKLISNLQGPTREALVAAQRRWLQFRDAEIRFIDLHWSRKRSGSSADLSAAAYRNALTKERIVQLLRYTAEYQ